MRRCIVKKKKFVGIGKPSDTLREKGKKETFARENIGRERGTVFNCRQFREQLYRRRERVEILKMVDVTACVNAVSVISTNAGKLLFCSIYLMFLTMAHFLLTKGWSTQSFF